MEELNCEIYTISLRVHLDIQDAGLISGYYIVGGLLEEY